MKVSENGSTSCIPLVWLYGSSHKGQIKQLVLGEGGGAHALFSLPMSPGYRDIEKYMKVKYMYGYSIYHFLSRRHSYSRPLPLYPFI